MSYGLKKYTHQLNQEVLDANFSVNTCDLNLIGQVPLIESSGKAPINLNLVFNLERYNENGLFGKGFKLDLYKKISMDGNDFKIENADGSEDIYYASNGYYNKETKIKLTEETEDGDVSNYMLTLEVDRNNYITFSSDSSEYPNYPYYIKKGKDRYGLDFISTTKHITNYEDKEVKLSVSNGHIAKIDLYVGGILKAYTNLVYENDRLVSIKRFKNGVYVNNYEFTFSDNLIKIKEINVEEELRYTVEGTKVKSFAKYYNNSLDEKSQISLIQLQGHTKVIDYKGNEDFIFYESGLPVMYINHKKECKELAYDFETKEIIYDGDAINYNLERSLLGLSVSDFSKAEFVSFSEAQITYPAYSNILNGSLLHVKGPGTLTKTINVSGLGGDMFEFALFVGYKNSNNSISIILKTDTGEVSERKIPQGEIVSKVISLGLRPLKSYDSITVIIDVLNFDGYLGGVRLFKKSFGTTAIYDTKGNIIGSSNGQAKSNFKYNTNNQLIDVSTSKGMTYGVKYDSEGRMISSNSAYGISNEIEYIDSDSSNNNNLTIKSTTKVENIENVTTSKYDAYGYLSSEIDEIGNTTSYIYDMMGSLKKVVDSLGKVTEYDYDSFNNMITMSLNGGNTTRYSYDSRHKLIRIKNENLEYSFKYDNFNNISEVSLNNTVLAKLTYENDNIVSMRYGESGDIYYFSYDVEDNIKEIKYGSSIRYRFNYNNLNQLISITNQAGEVLNRYEYDLEGNVIKDSSNYHDLSYTYDNNGNLIRSSYNINNKKIIQSYETLSRSEGSYPEMILNEFEDCDFNVGLFLLNSNLKGNNKEYESLDTSSRQYQKELVRDNNVPCLDFGRNPKGIVYKVENENYGYPVGTVGMWFKPSSLSTTEYLFSQKNNKGNGFLGVYIKDKKLHVEIYNSNNTRIELLTSKYEVRNNAWNFFGISYYLPTSDGYSDGDDGEIKFCLNGNIQTMEMTGRNYGLEMDKNPAYHIGHMYYNGELSPFDGKIALLMIGNNNTNLNANEMMNFYKLTHDYICDNQNDFDYRAVKSSGTSLYTLDSTILNQYEIFPLKNDLKSLKGKEPKKFDLRAYAKYDSDRSFNYNYLNKDYSFVADGNMLEYNLNIGDSGTIMFRAYTDAKTSNQYFFEARNKAKTRLGLYKDSNDMLCLDLDGTIVTTGLKFTAGAWHTVGISYDTEDPNDSQVVFKYKNLRFYLDGKIEERKITTWFNYSNLSLLIGRRYDTESIDNYNDSYPLLGQIEMLAVSNYYVSASTLNNLSNEINGINKINEYNELDMLRYSKVYSGSKQILSNYYSYKTNSKYQNALSSIIEEESKFYGSSHYIRSYKTDSLGNVTNVSDSVFGSHAYTYNSRGFLIKEDNTSYTYDDNGNMITSGNSTYKYDNLNRLISINGDSIFYSFTNPGNPRLFKDTEYKFEGRRLVGISEDLGVDEQQTVDYTYNSNGLIIKKVLGYWYADDRDSEEYTTKYYYDGEKLITEIGPRNRLDFLYDENGILYGLIKDSSRKYFYIRDFMSNILGLVDDSGNIVVKYKYDAYGNRISITDTSGCDLGNINPFRYKGYYYDDDVEMYYCKSRFYVPSWHRWLNSDSINYLEPKNITSLNLFTYCNNNPVMYVDENGKFPGLITAMLIGAVIGAFVGVVGQAGADVLSNLWKYGFKTYEWSMSSWQTYVGAAVGGAVGGALTPILGPVSTSAINGAVSSFVGMELENSTGNSNYSFGAILSTSLFSGAFSGLTAGAVDKIKIPKVTSGRGSLSSIQKQINTKLIKNKISCISAKTFGKMLALEFCNSIPSNFLNSFTNGMVLIPVTDNF